MGCCGRGIPDLRPAGARPAAAAANPAAAAPRRYSHAFFEYVGPTALTARGGVTGTRYRFDRPGARVAVEPADQASLAAVPQLRRVLAP